MKRFFLFWRSLSIRGPLNIDRALKIKINSLFNNSVRRVRIYLWIHIFRALISSRLRLEQMFSWNIKQNLVFKKICIEIKWNSLFWTNYCLQLPTTFRLFYYWDNYKLIYKKHTYFEHEGTESCKFKNTIELRSKQQW